MALQDEVKIKENAEGFGQARQTDMNVPGSRSVPASSRALAQLAGQRGRIY